MTVKPPADSMKSKLAFTLLPIQPFFSANQYGGYRLSNVKNIHSPKSTAHSEKVPLVNFNGSLLRLGATISRIKRQRWCESENSLEAIIIQQNLPQRSADNRSNMTHHLVQALFGKSTPKCLGFTWTMHPFPMKKYVELCENNKEMVDQNGSNIKWASISRGSEAVLL